MATNSYLSQRILEIMKKAFDDAKVVDYPDFEDNPIPFVYFDDRVILNAINGIIPIVKTEPRQSFKRRVDDLLKTASSEEKLWLLNKLKRFEANKQKQL